jgi:hypothetical protein
VREGQRFAGQAVELFFVRPMFMRPGKFTEEPIARLQYIRSRDVWRLYWRRADGNWHRYSPSPQAESLLHALQVIDEDAKQCFFG